MTQPYDEYVDHIMSELSCEPRGVWGTYGGYTIHYAALRELISNAWLSGLEHSLKLIEGEKHDRETRSQPNPL